MELIPKSPIRILLCFFADFCQNVLFFNHFLQRIVSSIYKSQEETSKKTLEEILKPGLGKISKKRIKFIGVRVIKQTLVAARVL
jgi:hypothetical protein